MRTKISRHQEPIANDDPIADILNRKKLVTGHGNRWTRERVTALRSHRQPGSISPKRQRSSTSGPRHSGSQPKAARSTQTTRFATSVGFQPSDSRWISQPVRPALPRSPAKLHGVDPRTYLAACSPSSSICGPPRVPTSSCPRPGPLCAPVTGARRDTVRPRGPRKNQAFRGLPTTAATARASVI